MDDRCILWGKKRTSLATCKMRTSAISRKRAQTLEVESVFQTGRHPQRLLVVARGRLGPILLQKSVGSTLSAGLRSENLGSRSLGRLPGMGGGDARALMPDATNATDATYATLGAAVSGGWSVSLARRRRF